MRRVLIVVAALVLAGCGGSSNHTVAPPKSPYLHFVSRPDLQPPRVTVRKAAAGTAPGYLFLAPKRGKIAGPLIMDDHGNVVWFDSVSPQQATDFRVQSFRGRPVLTWWEGTTPVLGVGRGKYLVADVSYRKVAELDPPAGLWYDLHEFQLTRRGTALITAYKKTQVSVGAKKTWVFDGVVREVDVPSGRVVFEWHSLPHVPLAESALPPPKQTSEKAPYDYFHVNSVALDRDGDYIVSARNTSTIYKLRHDDGSIVWRLGGKHSDFAPSAGVTFHWQHDAKRNPDGTLTIFDNDAMPKMAKHSRALVLDVDESAKTARLVRSYAHPAKLLSPHQGDIQELPNGDVFIGWGGIPVISEFSKDARLLFDAKISVGDTYRAYRFPWTGRPTEPPAAAIRGDVVYASWNGATEVARWQALGGSSRGALKPIGDAPRRGFETAIPLHAKPKYVAVRALAADGTALATSRVLTR